MRGHRSALSRRAGTDVTRAASQRGVTVTQRPGHFAEAITVEQAMNGLRSLVGSASLAVVAAMIATMIATVASPAAAGLAAQSEPEIIVPRGVLVGVSRLH